MVNKKRLRPFIPLIISLSVGLVLFTLMEDFLEKVIIQPFLQVIWFISLIVQSLPQAVVWAGFIFIMLFATSASIWKGGKTTSVTWAKPPTNTGTVERWARLLDNTQLSTYSKWRLAQKLKQLTQELLSAIDVDGRARIDITELELPEEIKAYFEAPLPSRISPLKRFKRKNELSDSALDLDPEVILLHLQERLDL